MSQNIIDAIKSRRSIRSFNENPISDENINTIIEAGQWAPSGKNNQPWRFLILNKEEQMALSNLTIYKKTMESAQNCIAVFLHEPSGYNRDRDLMAMGACIQNMLLAAHSLEIGSLWLGEILNKKDEVRDTLNLSEKYDLAAVIALGYYDTHPHKERKSLGDLIIRRF